MPARRLVAEELSRLLNVLGHPMRIRIIEELGTGEKDVHELEVTLEAPQPTVSQHLAALKNFRLVEGRREGRHVYYSLTQKWTASWLLDGLKWLEKQGNASADLLAAAREARSLWGSRRGT